MHSQWGGDTSDLNVDSVTTDIAAGDALGDDGLLDTAELPGAGARLQYGRGIFRCVSQKARTQLVDRGSAATAAAGASAAEAIPDVSCSELVDCLERTCEEVRPVARWHRRYVAAACGVADAWTPPSHELLLSCRQAP